MVKLHFANITEEAKCQHVRARSKDNLRQYLEVVHHVGADVGYDRGSLMERFQQYAGESKSAAEETHSLLKKLDLLQADGSPTDAGRFAGMVAAENRMGLLQDIFIQHMRGMPTIAYTIDILRRRGTILTPDEIYADIVEISTIDSSAETNSVRNALNLLADFDVAAESDQGFEYLSRDQTVLESVVYGVYLLGYDGETVEARVLRERLPRLIHCTETSSEELFSRARKQYALFSYRTQGDHSRSKPYGGVFDVQVSDVGPNDLYDALVR